MGDTIADFCGSAVSKLGEIGDWIGEKFDDTLDALNGSGGQLGNISSSSAKELSQIGAYDYENAS